jgi:hypothetical protein
MLALIAIYGVNACVFDEFRVLHEFHSWQEGTLRFFNLYDQHMVHRHLVPFAAMLVIAATTAFNSVAFMVASWVLYLIVALALFLVWRAQITTRDVHSLWFVPVTALLFSLAQHEGFLSGFQLVYAFTLSFAVVALFCLQRWAAATGASGPKWFFAAILAAALASFSSTMGLPVWLAGLWVIATAGRRTKPWRVGAVWVGCGIATSVLYFYSMKLPQAELYVSQLATPLRIPRSTVVLLGNGLFYGAPGSFWVGCSTLLAIGTVIVWVIRRHALGRDRFWLALLIFSLVNCAAIAFGATADIEASKYTAFAIPALIGAYAMAVQSAHELNPGRRRLVLGGVVAIVGLGLVISTVNGLRDARTLNSKNRQCAFVLSTFDTQPDEVIVQILRFRAAFLRPLAEFLRERKLNVFRSAGIVNELPPGIPPSGTTDNALLDRVGGAEVPSEGNVAAPVHLSEQFVDLRGWAIDESAGSPAGGVILEIDGRQYPAFYGTERNDLASSFQRDAYRYCGFERSIRLDGIPPGRHLMKVFVLSRDGKSYRIAKQQVQLLVEE